MRWTSPIAISAAALCWATATGAKTDCPSHLQVQVPRNSTMDEVHSILSSCSSIQSLSLQVAQLGCVGHPERWSLPLDPSGRSRYLSRPDKLSLGGYRFQDLDLDYIRPPGSSVGRYVNPWMVSGKAWAWLRWQFLSPLQRSTINIDLWLGAMDFSFIRELTILHYHGDPEVLVSRLPARLPRLQSLTVGGPGLHQLVLAMQDNPLEHLSLLDPGPSHNLAAILDAHGKTLKSLQWHNLEGLSARRPVISEFELQRLHATAPNLQSLTLDLNRHDEDWPWESLKALRQGLPQSLEHLTIYFEMASECRRQKRDDYYHNCGEPCMPAEQYAQPLLTAEAAQAMSRFLMRDAPSTLSHISFFAGYPEDYESLNGNEANWLFGKWAALECGIADGEVDCTGVDAVISEDEKNWHKRFCSKSQESQKVDRGYPHKEL
ncbi:uncharacterized protein PG998_010359 [Apiospora kogelbergensis]|uniref:uncharacterized protein n=1 Tax=Apiospora kogelbergensis TaxID=1337665 RepID=UPI00312E047C